MLKLITRALAASVILVSSGCMDKEPSLEQDQASATRGDVRAAHRVVVHYNFEGQDAPPSEKKHWFRVAADLGSAAGMQALALQLYKEGNCVEAISWLQASAKDPTFARANGDWIRQISADTGTCDASSATIQTTGE